MTVLWFLVNWIVINGRCLRVSSGTLEEVYFYILLQSLYVTSSGSFQYLRSCTVATLPLNPCVCMLNLMLCLKQMNAVCFSQGHIIIALFLDIPTAFNSREDIFLESRDASDLARAYSSYISEHLSASRKSAHIGALIIEPGKTSCLLYLICLVPAPERFVDLICVSIMWLHNPLFGPLKLVQLVRLFVHGTYGGLEFLLTMFPACR